VQVIAIASPKRITRCEVFRKQNLYLAGGSEKKREFSSEEKMDKTRAIRTREENA
jgi:hypothetical protein